MKVGGDYMSVHRTLFACSFNNNFLTKYVSTPNDTSIQLGFAAFRRTEMRRKISHSPSCAWGLLNS